MINSKRYQMLIVLLLVFMCVTAFGNDPNQVSSVWMITSSEMESEVFRLPLPELKFEVMDEKMDFPGGEKSFKEMDVKPKYMATLFLKENCYLSKISYSEKLKQLSKTPAFKSMSEEQKKLLESAEVVKGIGRGDGLNHLYAVSIDDAKKMAQAVMEVLSDPKVRLSLYELGLKDLEDESNIKYKDIYNVDELRERIDAFSLNSDSPYLSLEEAKENITELNAKLNGLEIEFAGLRAKQIAIREQTVVQQIRRDNNNARAKENTPTDGIDRQSILNKLEEMQIDLAIEMDSLKGSMEKARVIRDQAVSFCGDRNDRIVTIKNEIDEWEADYERTAEKIHKIGNMFANRMRDLAIEMPMLRLAQDPIAVYPVRIREPKEADKKLD